MTDYEWLTSKNLSRYKKVNLMDIATVERAAKGKIYPAGSLMIQLSASDGLVYYKDDDGEIDSKYAVICIKDNTYEPEYIFLTLQRSIPEFIAKYKTDINLQFDALKYIEFFVHDEKETRMYFVEMMHQLDMAIEEEKKIIDYHKEMKKGYLSKLFC